MPAGDAGPEDPDEAVERAGMLLAAGRPEAAVSLLSAALAAHPGRPWLWGQLGAALLAADRMDAALAAASRCVRLAPDDEWGHRVTSAALSRLGRHAEAADAARTAVRLAPRCWQPHARLAQALCAAAAPAGGDLAEARDEAGRAVELAPEEPEAHRTVGLVALVRQDWTQADAAYREVLALRPDDAAARSDLAMVDLNVHSARMVGRVGSAATGFSDALAVDPELAAATEGLAASAQVALIRCLSWPLLLGACHLVALHPDVATQMVPGVTVAAVLVAAVHVLRWRALPGPVRSFAVRLPRTDSDVRSLLIVLVAGWLALGVVPSAYLLGSHRVAFGAAVVSVAVPLLMLLHLSE